MFNFIVVVCLGVAVVNAGFHHKFNNHHHHITYDMNGFKGHHHEFSGTFEPDRQFGPHPPSPVYGPPPPSPVYGPPPPFPHHHMHSPNFPMVFTHQSGFQHNHGTNFGTSFGFSNMMPFNPFQEPSGTMPFNPQIPFNMPDSNNFFGGNKPTNTKPNINKYDASNGPSNIPVNTPSSLPADPLPTLPSTYEVFSPIPLDANTVFGDSNNVQSSTVPNTPDILSPFNVNSQPQNGIPINSPNGFEGSTEATNPSIPKTNQNNDNNYNDAEAIPSNNNMDINNPAIVPNVSEPESTTSPSSTQGNNEPMYDIDIRFSDSNDNRTNQKPLDTIK